MSMDREQESLADAALVELEAKWMACYKRAEKWSRKQEAAHERAKHVLAVMMEAGAAEEAVIRAMVNQRATTVDGIFSKARIVSSLWRKGARISLPEFVDCITRRLDSTAAGDEPAHFWEVLIGSEEDALIYSIARDLVAMLGRQGEGR